jgi:hypothetical protein
MAAKQPVTLLRPAAQRRGISGCETASRERYIRQRGL